MKLLRISGLILFLLSVIAYAGYKGYEWNNRDTFGPNITYQGDCISVSVNTPEENLLKDVTASDEKDGDVTNSIMVEEISKFNSAGSRTITYAAFDSNNNISKVERKLTYTDYIRPRFSLSKPLRFIVGDIDSVLSYLTAWDCIDGDLTRKIKYIEQESGFGQAEGIYKVEFQVTNAVGDTVYLPTEVEFYYPSSENESFTPQISLRDYLVYKKVGEYFDVYSDIEKVSIGLTDYVFQDGQSNKGNIKTLSREDISIQSDVNMRIPGVYNIEYSMTKDGLTGKTRLIVVVEE